MKLISINSRKFLGDYIDSQRRDSLAEGHLWSGLLLFGALLTVYCLAGGASTFVAIVCVIILGTVLGFALKRYRPYTILSCISGVVALTPSSKRPMPKAA